MPASAGRFVDSPRRSDRASITVLLGVYLGLLVVIPTRMIWKPMGALGMPSIVFAAVTSLVWATAVCTPEPLIVRQSVPVRWMMAMLWTSTLLSFAVMHWHAVPGVEARSADRFLVYLLGWSAICLLIAELAKTETDLYRLIRWTVWATSFVAAVAVLQFYVGFDLTQYLIKIPGLVPNGDYVAVLQRNSFRRPSGTSTHPIELACVVSMATPLAIHYALYSDGKRWVRWTPVALLAIAVPIAVSRSALLGAVVGLTVYLAGWAPKRRLRALGVVACIGPFVFMTSPGLLGALRSLVVQAPSDESITTRTSDYAVVARLMRQSPLIGRGPDTFLAAYRILDNQYLLNVINLGVIGLFVFTVYFMVPVLLGRGVRHRAQDECTRDLGQALAAAGAVVVASGLAFDSLTFPMFAGFVPVYVGLSGAAWGLVREGALGRPSREPSKFIHLRAPAVARSE